MINPDGSYLINDKSHYHINIINISYEEVKKLKNTLDKVFIVGKWDLVNEVKIIVAKTNLRCKEIENYILEYKPIYDNSINELINISKEWAISSDMDKEDLLIEFQNQAINKLEVIPTKKIISLLTTSITDFTIDDIFIERFGMENFEFYLSYFHSGIKVHKLNADSWGRQKFEKLVELGLARRGKEIPIEDIINVLTLNEMNEILKGRIDKKITRKAQGIELFVKQEDAWELLSKNLSFRELFQLVQLPEDLKPYNLDKIKESWEYAEIIAEIILDTYERSYKAKKDFDEHVKELKEGWIKENWKIQNYDAICPCCIKDTEKKYPINRYPKVPHHIGCTCEVNYDF